MKFTYSAFVLYGGIFNVALSAQLHGWMAVVYSVLGFMLLWTFCREIDSESQ